MSNVMKGVRVLEAAEFAMAPSAAAVLADWGADVIKIEHAQRGDAVRNSSAWGVKPGDGGFCFLWESFNRGKRAIGIDLTVPEGREILLKLVKQADIFITNYLPAARRKLKIDVEDLRAVNPQLIYARGSAHGPKGPEAEIGGFDGLTYWMRSGVGVAAMPANTNTLIGLPAPAFGDIQAGMSLAGGLAAALYHREKTKEPLVVDISLMSAGLWAMQAYLVGANVTGQRELPNMDRQRAFNPVWNEYRTKDGQFIALAMFQSDKYWAGFCDVMGREDLKTDPRFINSEAREKHREECIKILDSEFASRNYAEWEMLLRQQNGQWSRVQVVTDLNSDPQVLANGYLQEVDYKDGRKLMLATNPIQFNETQPELRPAPELGQNTEEILLELGLDWERIIELKDKGAVN